MRTLVHGLDLSGKETSRHHNQEATGNMTTKGCSKMVREVHVTCGTSRRIVEIDFSDFQKTLKEIRRKWELPSATQFTLQTTPTGEKCLPCDITDADELARFKDADEFLIRLIHDTGPPDPVTQSYVPNSTDTPDAPPTYQQSMGSIKSRTTVHYGSKRKQIFVDRTKFNSIHETVVNRFKPESDFKLQVQDADGVRGDIECDEDLMDNADLTHTIWIVEFQSSEKSVLPSESDKKLHLVTIKGTDYPLTECPPTSCKIVQAEMVKLQDSIDIPSISGELGEIADNLKIAYYATAGDPEVQKQVQNMQFEIQKLCAKTDTTLLQMQTKAGDALNEMLCGFGYMLDGFEEFGTERLGSVGQISKEIKTATEGLVKMAEDQESIAQLCLDDVFKQGDSAIKAKEDELKIVEEGFKLRMKGAQKDIETSQASVKTLRVKEDDAVEAERKNLYDDSGYNFALRKFFTGGYYDGSSKLAEQNRRIAKEAKEEREKETARLHQEKEKLFGLISARAQAAAKMAQHKDDPKILSDQATHCAKEGLRSLHITLRGIANFWGQNEVEFSTIGDTKALDQLKSAVDDDGRKAIWTGRTFKMEAFNKIVRFVAIQKLCKEFRKTMRTVLQDISKGLRDNPTREQALQRIDQLQANTQARMLTYRKMRHDSSMETGSSQLCIEESDSIPAYEGAADGAESQTDGPIIEEVA